MQTRIPIQPARTGSRLDFVYFPYLLRKLDTVLEIAEEEKEFIEEAREQKRSESGLAWESQKV